MPNDTKAFETFAQGMEKFGIPVHGGLLEKFRIYLAELIACPHNLTAVLDPLGVVTTHFLDSLSVLPVLKFNDSGRFCDLGSGAGFPLLPLKLVNPAWDAAFIDSKLKSLEFIAQTAVKTGAGDITIFHGHTSELKRKNTAGTFDELLVRALGPVERVLDQTDFLVKKGGRLILYKGPGYAGELTAAAGILGMKFIHEESLRVEVPFLDRERWLLTFRRL